MPRQISDEVALEHLRRKASDLGRTPFTREIREDPSMPGHTLYFNRFGSYTEACRQAGIGLPPQQAPNGTYASLLDRHLRRNYGITEADYWRMHEEQDGRCAICRGDDFGRNGHGALPRLSVDHDHQTGEVRALLCRRCNHTLGTVEDDPELLKRMADYLQRYSVVSGASPGT